MDLKVAICDDEKHHMNNLIFLIERYEKSKKIKFSYDCYTSGEDIMMSEILYDIVFLDIKMKKLDGLETGKMIKKRKPTTLIIYVTNYNQYYKEAFGLHAFMYLEKPVSYVDIETILNDSVDYLNQLKKKELFHIYFKGTVFKLDVDEVLYFEYTERKVKIFSQTQIFYFRSTMKNIYEQIQIHGFGMPHSAFIVNYRFISKISGYNLFLKNDVLIPISQRKIAQFKENYYEYLHNMYHFIR